VKELIKNLKSVCDTLFNRLKSYIDVFGIGAIIAHINLEADSIKNQLRITHEAFNELRKEAEEFESQAYYFRSQLVAMGDAMPDMLWAKDLEGRYTYANSHIINNLLFSQSLENTLYKTDLDHAMAEKARVGSKNHTFGEVCGNSDSVVLKEKRPMKFLEYGKVKGEMLYLEVHKNIFRNSKGEIIGTVGVGRDVTHEYTALKKAIHNDSLSNEEYKNILIDILDAYKFQNDEEPVNG
jgi:PAS domain-containing protein